VSDKQHLQDAEDRVPHANPKSLSGGKCLNRHKGGAPCDVATRDSCWHRWQAYEKMASETGYYNYPKYQSLVFRQSPGFYVGQAGMPRYPRRWLARPAPHEWDYGNSCTRRISGQTTPVPIQNFYVQASTPYNHQAHHLIPNAELADTILEVFSGISPIASIAVRRGLAGAGYNLNHADNMIMLPMDRVVSRAIGLPLHQSCWAARSHKAWSAYARGKIKPIFEPLRQQMEAHKKRDYASVKTQLEAMAVTLRNEVLASTVASLDAHANSVTSAAGTPGSTGTP